uniref:Uncharacterized protein n=1 Tax=Parascaris equorum TaxID=6256 RepID=A0A914S6E8_PAREQ
MMSSVEEWVNDELHSLTGISDRTIGQFIMALARKSTDTDDLVQRFRDTDALQITAEVRNFASSLLSMIPHAVMRLNRRLKLVSSDEEDEVPLKKRKEIAVIFCIIPHFLSAFTAFNSAYNQKLKQIYQR